MDPTCISPLDICRYVFYIFSDLNNVPKFNNLPATLDVLEDTAAGTTLFSPIPYDADAGAILSYTLTVDPVTATSLFTYNTNSTLNIS